MVFGIKMPIVEVERGGRGNLKKKKVNQQNLIINIGCEVVGSRDSRRRFTGRYPDL